MMLKRLMMALALVVIGPLPASVADAAVEQSLQQVTLSVKNLSCGMCKYTVENALKQVEGVQSAKVDMDKAVAVVTYDPARVQVDQLVEAVSRAGYPAAVKQ